MANPRRIGSYLHISLKVDVSNNSITALTTVENKSYRSKELSYAFLLVAPDIESPIKTANAILKKIGNDSVLTKTNEFIIFKELNIFQPLYDDNIALIPLNFYYFENVKIGDETLTYRAILDRTHLQSGVPYSVRFYIFAKNRLHRSVQDCFIF